MRYWTYISGEVKGPFEAGLLREQPGFELASLVCPENPDGSAASDWKEAAGYPDIKAALLAPALPPPPRKPAAESPLAMTMRGTLISDPVVDGKVIESPAPAPVPAPPPGPQAAPSEPVTFVQQLERLNATLSTLAVGQAQMMERLNRMEQAMTAMKAMLFPEPPK
jgi:hypothetical protein